MDTRKNYTEEKRIAHLKQIDFDFIATHFRKRIKQFLRDLDVYQDSRHLLEISKRAFYLQHYLYNMSYPDTGYEAISENLEKQFIKDHGTASILKDIQYRAYTKALERISGPIRIGENTFFVLNKITYYRSLKGKWYSVDPQNVFYFIPELGTTAAQNVIALLEQQYLPTRYDKIFTTWKEKNYPSDIRYALLYVHGVTTPEEYFSKTVEQIKILIQNPVSPESLSVLFDQPEHTIEMLCKRSSNIVAFVQQIQEKKVFPLYLLRDCLMFAEVQKTLELLNNTSHTGNQIMINRGLLSRNNNDQYYWTLSVDAIYEVLRNNPRTFSEFYKQYVNSMRQLEKKYPDMQRLLKNISVSIKPHIKDALDTNQKIVVVDTGLQGSITLLTKYLIDTYLLNAPSQASTDMYLYVVGDWFKKIFNHRYASDYYPIMQEIESFCRSENLYTYKKKSFETGKLEITMGSYEHQRLSNLELIVLVMTTMIMNESRLV